MPMLRYMRAVPAHNVIAVAKGTFRWKFLSRLDSGNPPKGVEGDGNIWIESIAVPSKRIGEDADFDHRD